MQHPDLRRFGPVLPAHARRRLVQLKKALAGVPATHAIGSC